MSFTHERARVAALTRHHPDDPEVAADGRRRLKVIRAERLIENLTGSDPVLTLPQRVRLASLLLGVAGGDDAA